MANKAGALWATIFLVAMATITTAKRPNVVFIVVDDLGWNDVGFRNPNIITPNVDRLALNGVILDQAYVQPLCSPSRQSFMTGYYPFRVGHQHLVIFPNQAVCAPLNVTFLPMEMKKLGYATHMVGKWHLGFCSWQCTPTYRGFDSFMGYYNAREDYYYRSLKDFYDFRDNETISVKEIGIYSTYVFQERVRKIIENHDTNTPFFLYLPLQSVHPPLEVPKPYYDMYPNIKNEKRRILSGMVTAMDDVVGNLTSFLIDRDMYNDTLFVLTADNGGSLMSGASNYPLRGGKTTIWEGGTRATAFVSGAGLDKVKGTRYHGLLHAVDWMPTIVAAAGGQVQDDDIDGKNLWDAISNGNESPRTEFIYNLDYSPFPYQGRAAIRQGDYKLIVGYPGLYSGWHDPGNMSGCREAGEALEATDMSSTLRENVQPSIWKNHYRKTRKVRLYNLKDDPTERHNLAEQMPCMVKQLKKRIAEYMTQYAEPDNPPKDPASDPTKYRGAWTPGWC